MISLFNRSEFTFPGHQIDDLQFKGKSAEVVSIQVKHETKKNVLYLSDDFKAYLEAIQCKKESIIIII